MHKALKVDENWDDIPNSGQDTNTLEPPQSSVFHKYQRAHRLKRSQVHIILATEMQMIASTAIVKKKSSEITQNLFIHHVLNNL